MQRFWSVSAGLVGLVLCCALLAGCCGAPRQELLAQAAAAGRYGEARTWLGKHRVRDRANRDYLLDLMRLGLLTLADGYRDAGEATFGEIFETLRTAGINADKTVASVVFNEDHKFWKGEPFEQALAYHYVGLHYGIQGGWDNVRAAADNSLFHLRDFGNDDDGEPLDTEALVYQDADSEEEDVLENYAVRESDFALGYLMSAIANQQLLRSAEADEQFEQVLQLRPALVPLVEALRSGRYNAVLVVDFGLGPRKVGVGPDYAIAKFLPVIASDDAPLIVTVSKDVADSADIATDNDVAIGDAVAQYHAVCDVNVMAGSHMWNNLEDVRVAKSHVGSLLLIGGAIATAHGASEGSAETALIGLGVMAAGAFAKAGAHADTRHCELLPQRVYVVPVNINSPTDRLRLEVQGHEDSAMVLTGLSPPDSAEPAALRYVRLNSLVPSGAADAPHWAVSGRIHYHNDAAGADDPQATTLPYILGGHCVRKPTEQVLADYRKAGHLTSTTLTQLYDLYRAEGIRWDDDDAYGQPAMHVLEGGASLATPLPGSAGFARLFGQTHSPYRPRSQVVRNMQLEMMNE